MTILLYLLRRLEPEAFRDNIDIKTYTVTPSNPAWEEFKPGLLAYVYWFINDFGTGYGKYLSCYIATDEFWDSSAKRPKRTCHVWVKPKDLHEGGGHTYPAVPTLLKYDETNGIYQIYMQFFPHGLPIHRKFYIGAFFSPDVIPINVPENANVLVVIGRLVVEEVDFQKLLNAWYKLIKGEIVKPVVKV